MRSFLSILITSLALVACAAPAQRPPADTILGKHFTKPPAGSLIVLLPPAQTPDFEAGENFMAAQLGAQLMAAGYRAAMLPASNYNEIWQQEIAAVGGIFDPATGASRPEAFTLAMGNLARRICAEAQCAMIIQQRLVERTATLNGFVADWDGQTRRIQTRGALGQDYKFTGSTLAISVELVGVMADGGVGFRTYGGATLPFQTNVRESRNELRANLFQDDKEIADGVRISLQPLLAN